ncbi:MAG: fused MFS/spermidine synthase [Candidatus Krumholzibacteriota bacterium]|nr:fused MFS/spermidine synthase [Candidatus Krumholzibacteriota bacterium]
MENSVNEKRKTNFLLYLVVSVSGAAVLALELLGTRILGPYYGVSIFLWSAIITVTLAALAAGYSIGGHIADRGISMRGLGIIILTAGLYLCLIPLLKRPVLSIIEPMGLRPSVLIAALILFFPPLMLLGMVTPSAVKIKASVLSEVGRAAGSLYSVSTVASVAAALLTGFVLIPALAVSHILFATGALLFMTSALIFLTGRRRGNALIALILFILSLAAIVFIPSSPYASGKAVFIGTGHSPYAEIDVVDFLEARFLLIDGSIHTCTDIETGKNIMPYVNVLDIARNICGDSGNALLIGLGGGSVAKNLSSLGWTVDGVEIDPVVIRFAKEHFGLAEKDAFVYQTDGRRFLVETDDLYDLIIFDAFGSGTVPFHLVTKESVELAARRLRPGGVIAMNFLTVGWRSRIVTSMAATLRTSFREVVALPIAEPPNTLGNLVLLASDSLLSLSYDIPEPSGRFTAEYDMNHSWNNRFNPDSSGAVIFTDDKNPIDLWSEEVNLADRQNLKKYFREAGIKW